jgi:L-glyceraldehyde 3-phosphate reductase
MIRIGKQENLYRYKCAFPVLGNKQKPAIGKVKQLNKIALQREQILAQMALVWLLKDPRVTSVLIGASYVAQLDDNVAALKNSQFTKAELVLIEQILSDV